MELDRLFAASPYRIRSVSAPVLQAPADDAAWVTEALIGEPARILQEWRGWARIVLPLQPSALHPEGYPGWVRLENLVESSGLPAWQTTSARTRVSGDRGEAVAELSLGSLLPVGTQPAPAGQVPVRLPNGSSGFVPATDVAGWPLSPSDRDTVLHIMRVWTGQPYVWGGTSSIAGADCSGMVYRVYQRAGRVIPRDADDQYHGAPRKVWGTIEGALPGDPVFFQRPEEGHIDHVGLYVGDGLYFSEYSATGGVSTHELVRDGFVAWASYLD